MNQATPLVFFQLNKIDEAKRLVFGRAVQEVPDRVGEIFDYETSVPNFRSWAASQFDASLGKSNGNVRAMHKDVAAGIVIPGGLTFNDAEKAIDICVKVTDDAEWAKCESGTYTGFSIGGKYAKKWEDTELKKTRYTADPSEISLVDRPCIPTSKFFEIQKADGVIVQKEFAQLEHKEGDPECKCKKCAEKLAAGKSDGGDLSKTDDALSAEVTSAVAVEDEYDIEATPEQVDEFCKLLAATKTPFAAVLADLKKGHAPTKEAEAGETPAEEAKETPAEQAAEDKAGVEMTEEEKAAFKAKKAKEDAEASAKADAIDGLTKAAADLNALAIDLVKAGARNSKLDQGRLQKAHDALNEAGARCHKAFLFADDDPGVVDLGNLKAEPSEDLKKAVTEALELRKIVESLTADVKMLKAQPMPSTIRLRAVSKGEDFAVDDPNRKEIEPVKDDHGEVRKAATSIKEIHQSGGAPLYKFGT